MSATNPPTITPAPSPAPSRKDPVNFRERADTYHTWLVPFVNTQLPAVLEWIRTTANSVYIWSTAASASKDAAAASAASAAANAANAAAANGATAWVSGTTYTAGAVRWSPITGRTYRRLTAGAGTTDPSADPTNWALLSVVVEQSDVGTAPGQVSVNQYLGRLAFMNPEAAVFCPQASVTPASLGDMVFQLTNDTTLVIKVKGKDGTVRAATLTLA